MKSKILFLSFLFISCKTFKYAFAEKVIAKKGCIPVTVQQLPIIELELENKKQLFAFDTGSMASVLLDSTIIEGFGNKQFATFGSHRGADRKKQPNRILTAKIFSGLFESDNKLLIVSAFPKLKCSGKSTFRGIIGLDAFFDDNTSLLLNFTANEICNIDAATLAEKLKEKEDYKLVKSECKKNQVFVYLQVEGNEMKFKLDTGYSGNIVIPFSTKAHFSNNNTMVLEGTLHRTISSFSVGSEILYQRMPIFFAGENFESKVNVSTSIKAQNIGINFIKGFDWIIDFNNNKVYVKRNQNKIENTFNRKVSYYAKAEKEKLLIITKEKSQTKYNLGDEIVSVNGQRVTPANNCEMQDLLNKTEDWNTLQLEVVPPAQ